ncbi:hypothetical protein LTR78_004033 [Recurvomyces mirabilis]|uniref:Uncharacterized protein n=1 Tax=Recurvomyces mirabilis TaxID=574656 RepID=A0AAE0WR45_9PEZI|nr:hypothetical protein LTR78_004033 [Recurvomyces mirabilis]KAK5153829.1 hypothetical protein LTS14_007048 [Recurvomyces mirabilis]
MFAIPIVRASNRSQEAECKPTADVDADRNSEDTATTGPASPELMLIAIPEYTQQPQSPRTSRFAQKLQDASPRHQRSPPREASQTQFRERWRKWRTSNEIDVKLRAKRASINRELAGMNPEPGDAGKQQAVDTSIPAYRRNQRRWRKVQGSPWPSMPLRTEFEEDVVDEAYRTMSPREQRTFRQDFDYAPDEYVVLPKAETLDKAQRLGEEFVRKRKAGELEGEDEGDEEV